jgi:hypothetical protein
VLTERLKSVSLVRRGWDENLGRGDTHYWNLAERDGDHLYSHLVFDLERPVRSVRTITPIGARAYTGTKASVARLPAVDICTATSTALTASVSGYSGVYLPLRGDS